MRPPPRWIGPAAVAAGVGLAVWAWWLDRPPAPLASDAPPGEFSAGRAVEYLEHIAVRPHMTGSAENARVRDYLVGELRSLGFETEVQVATVATRNGRRVRAATVRNVVARRRGTASSGGVAIASHYDSQQLTPGAGDDGAGVAATLESLRALAAGEPLRNDLYVIITDAEELGLLGARAFVDEHRWWPEITVLLNFEARGSAGQSVMFETNENNGWVVRALARADPHPTGSSLYYEVYRRLPNDTDFSVYKRGGVTGLNFALAEGADVYHRPTDSVENLSPASLQHHGEHALAMLRHFGDLDLPAETTAPDVVFFRFVGLGLVSYPFAWVPWLSLLAVAFVLGVMGRGVRSRRVRAGAVLAGLATAVVAVSMSAALAWLLWSVVQGAHHELGSIQGRALYNEAWYGLAVGCLAVGCVAALYGAARRAFGAAGLVCGALLLPAAMVTVASAYAPGVSMLLVWPLVFGVGALRHLLSWGVEGTSDGGDLANTTPDCSDLAEISPDGGDLATITVLLAPVVLMLFPLIWTLYAGLNISAAPILAAAAALMLAITLPLFELAGRSNRVWLPAVAFGLAGVFAVVGVIDARPGPARPVPSDLVYALDRESDTAVWATMQPGADGWIERFVGGDAEVRDLAPFLAGDTRPYRLSPAPGLDTSPAEVSVVADTTDAGVRRLRLQVVSSIDPELSSIFPAPAGSTRLVAVNGVAVSMRGGGSGADWLLQHFGDPPGGVLSLEITTEDPETPVELVLVESLLRLPPIPGVDTTRPAGWVAHARRLTDAAMFRQRVTIE